jgi:dGTPase
MVNDIIKQSVKNVESQNIKSINDIYKNKIFLISMSENMKKDCNLIKEFLYQNVYNHPKLREKRLKVENITRNLFKYYSNNFHLLPDDWLVQEKNESKFRIICDYISGMTDRYASKLYKSIYE